MGFGFGQRNRSDLVEYEGRFSYGVENLEIFAWDLSTKLHVCSFCSIAGGRVLLGGGYRVDWVTTFPFGHVERDCFPSGSAHGAEGHPVTHGDVYIENGVWIGLGVTILSGARLANGSVLAAGALLNCETEPYSIYAGVPARLQRRRFSRDVVERVIELEWWNWPTEVLDLAVPLLQAPPTPESLTLLEKIKRVESL